jgi:phosphohistidine phosphatase
MMAMATRTLVILRHAKAVAPDGTADVLRPLTHRGRTDASAAGRWLVDMGYLPDLVLCSPARRTRETWHGVAEQLTRAPRTEYLEALYGAALTELVGAVTEADPDASTLLLIGHNPGLSQLTALLDPTTGSGLHTAGLAVHSAEDDWAEWGSGRAPVVASHTARG